MRVIALIDVPMRSVIKATVILSVLSIAAAAGNATSGRRTQRVRYTPWQPPPTNFRLRHAAALASAFRLPLGSSWSSPTKPLKFIHVTKSGGSSIEEFGKKHMFQWGKHDHAYEMALGSPVPAFYHNIPDNMTHMHL